MENEKVGSWGTLLVVTGLNTLDGGFSLLQVLRQLLIHGLAIEKNHFQALDRGCGGLRPLRLQSDCVQVVGRVLTVRILEEEVLLRWV